MIRIYRSCHAGGRRSVASIVCVLKPGRRAVNQSWLGLVILSKMVGDGLLLFYPHVETIVITTIILEELNNGSSLMRLDHQNCQLCNTFLDRFGWIFTAMFATPVAPGSRNSIDLVLQDLAQLKLKTFHLTYWLVVWLPCFIFPYIGNNME